MIVRCHAWLLIWATLALFSRSEGETVGRRGEETTCERPATKAMTFEFSRAMATQIIKAANVSDMTFDILPPIRHVKQQDVEDSGFDTLESWCDIDDAAIVARHGDTCYGAFRGTVGVNPLDTAQLYDPISWPFESCFVRLGFWRAYHLSFFNDNFREAIDRCMESASELVLTGHSQGGSIAVVASIDFKHYDPTVITFGGIRALREPCGEIEPSRHYRFVNTEDTEDGLYDGWANGFSNFGVHVGQAFLLDSVSTNPGVYLGVDDDSTRTPKEKDVHNREKYRAALENSFGEARCFPVQFGGWENGHWCHNDDECANGMCSHGACTDSPRAIGARCSDNTDCDSGICERSGLVFWRKRCGN